MRTSTLGLAVASLAVHSTAQKVVKFDIRGNRPTEAIKNVKRATGSYSAYLFNDIYNGMYSIEAEIGTPPQPFILQLDTGSTDVWVNSQSSTFCRQGNCADYYASANSSTYKVSVRNGFNVSYGDGSGAAGDYFTDVLSVAGINLTNQTVGLASTSDIANGLMGVGMVQTEGTCDQDSATSYCYPNLLDNMVSQGKIKSHAFSLYLNDLNQSTGNILFGGVDSARYSGDLVSLPMVGIELESGGTDDGRYTVAWTNFTITTPNGVEQFLSQPISVPALLDSGTTLAVLPSAIVDIIYKQMGAVELRGTAYAPCYLRTANATIDFHLGGTNGAVMQIPIREFLFNLDSETARIWRAFGGTDYCEVGLQKGDDGLPIFGDVILRTSYIVYDLDNRQIAVAKANFEPGKENIQEITNGTASNIPGVARTASAVSSLSSVLSASAGPSRITSGSGAATATAGLTTASIVPLAAFTTAKYTGQGGYTAMSSITTSAPSGTGHSSSSTSSGAANALTIPKMGLEGIFAAGFVGVFMAAGAGMVLL